MNRLYYGDNLDVLRNKIRDETVDLCYIDPPFNSKRNYFQIYNNIGEEDRAQAQAFVDTWEWADDARQGYESIITNNQGRFTRQSIELIKGFRNVLGEGSLLAYLVSLTLRIVEIHRVLKPTGSFYLHCDPTASHYLKLVLDAIFCSLGGDFRNEIIWWYETGGIPRSDFSRKHDIIFRYTKSKVWTFNAHDVMEPRSDEVLRRIATGNPNATRSTGQLRHPSDVFKIPAINAMAKERLGYQTQKPEALLERILKASSNEGDLVLDAYCGCGTTIAVAERLKRKWIGIDITYQSISVILKRLKDTFDKQILQNVTIDGIPQDMASAKALAHKKDDRVRKEFEKWAILTYSNNRAIINTKKGADKGIDGIAYFITSQSENERIIFQVKSGTVNRGTIATLRGDMEREQAPIGVLITLEKPTSQMRAEAKAAGTYNHKLMGRIYDRIQIVKVQDIIEKGKRLELPLSLEVVKSSQSQKETCEQQDLF